MANEYGPFHEAVKVVTFNPDTPTQVRQVSGVGSPAWVALTAAVFAECVTTPAQVGATGIYFADLPTGLSVARVYPLSVYAATATAFADAASESEYGPAATPANVTQVNGLAVTGTTIDSAAATAAAVAAALAGGTIVPRYYMQGEHLSLERGDAYKSSEGTGRRFTFTKLAAETHWPDTIGTVHFYCAPAGAAISNGRATALQRIDDVGCTVTQMTGDGRSFYLELAAALTGDLSPLAQSHDYEWELIANKADYPAKLRKGTFSAGQPVRTLA